MYVRLYVVYGLCHTGSKMWTRSGDQTTGGAASVDGDDVGNKRGLGDEFRKACLEKGLKGHQLLGNGWILMILISS